MKKTNTILVIIILSVIMAGCRKTKQLTDDFITVDVTKGYPKKEIAVQDVFDVEYIKLETNDNFLTMGIVQNIGEKVMITTNYGRGVPHGIFFFDRNGSGLRKISRRGQGPEEYASCNEIVLDEENNEIFIVSSVSRKIYVYDFFGNYKRSFAYIDSIDMYEHVASYDRDNLICHDGSWYIDYETRTFDPTHRNMFWIISKQDGSVTKEIEITYTKKIYTTLDINGSVFMPMNIKRIFPYHDSWILVEVSSDTIYRYMPEHRMIPFIVRTPSIQSMDAKVYLFPSVMNDRFYFLHAVKQEFDFEADRFFSKNLIYDRREKALFEYVLYNDDFTSKKPISDIWHRSLKAFLINSEEIAFAEKLESYELVDAYKEGKLKGKLKEIVATLGEEDNPVIMIAKHKR